MTVQGFRRWTLVHRWSSLACTVFLLVSCLTGLPLIFGDELEGWLGDEPPYPALPADAPMADLDTMVSTALHRHPGEIVTSLSFDDDAPKLIVSMAPSWQAFMDDPSTRRWLAFDTRTGALRQESEPAGSRQIGFSGLMLGLHEDLFAGLAGELFLGAMALLFVTAIVSGVVLYTPFAGKFAFGTIRTRRTARIKWLDLHNLLGMATLAWALVVGATGALNEISTPLFLLWQKTDVQALLQPWRGRPALANGETSSVEAAFDTASRATPGMAVAVIVFPGSPFGSPDHYFVWTKGSTPLASRLFSPVLVDAQTGRLTAVVRMPWYLQALELSRPLHFGDYGGLPLKIIWALLDLATIVVLGSGLYLWITPRRAALRAGSRTPGRTRRPDPAGT